MRYIEPMYFHLYIHYHIVEKQTHSETIAICRCDTEPLSHILYVIVLAVCAPSFRLGSHIFTEQSLCVVRAIVRFDLVLW